MIVILMGVSGCGKSSIGVALAERTGWAFLDADDFHPSANIAKMSQHEPLDDTDRGPWLDAICSRLVTTTDAGQSAIVACSALKQSYRQRLTSGIEADLRWVWLKADRDVIMARLQDRKDHFMPPALLDSQFDALEEPAGALVVDASAPLGAIVEAVFADLRP